MFKKYFTQINVYRLNKHLLQNKIVLSNYIYLDFRRLLSHLHGINNSVTRCERVMRHKIE